MTVSLLATKLHRPAPPARRVQRPLLVQRLDGGLAAGRRLTLVSAPAGFGKTTCVSEWLSSVAVPAAWLSLEPADDDPARFFAYLLAALQGVDRRIGREISGALHAGQVPPILSLTTGLLNDILQVGSKFILALDDFHVIREAVVLDAVGRLIAGQPDNMHLVLVTREDPLLPLARLRANNQMTEIRAADLRFNRAEAGYFLNRLMELPLSDADIGALENRTEGWIAGLQLAGLSMRGRSDLSTYIAGLNGSHRYILSYLTEEVLDRQPADIRGFLLRTSILDKLNGDLCAAVTGRPDCAGLLEQLCSANLFLIPLDDTREWYRYHHLFAQLLATRLRQTMPAEEVQALHCRASDWLAGNGFADDAIRHAFAGKDFERAVALVEQVARAMIFAGRMQTLRNWLAALPAAAGAAHPRLDVYRTWIDLLEGNLDFGEQAMQEREEMLQALPPSPENDRLRVELTAILCRYSPVFGNTVRTIRLVEEALKFVDESDLVTRARLIFAMGVAHGLEGNTGAAGAAFDDALRLARAAGELGLAAEILGLVAQAHGNRGQLHEAARCYQAIIDLETPGQAPFFPAGLGYLGLAGIHLEWNDQERAEACLARGIELCSRGGLDGIYAAYGIKSRLRQARGDLAGSLAEIEALEQAFQRGDDPYKAARRIAIARAMGDAAAVARSAEPWLSLVSADAPGPRPPTAVLEVAQVVVARVFLAQGDVGRALDLLDAIQATAGPAGRFGPLIEVYLLKALALQAQDRAAGAPAAVEYLERCLDLAEPEGYTLLFLEAGPAVLPLLRAVADRAAAPARRRRYAQALADAFGADGGRTNTTVTAAAPPTGATESAPVEALSPRELEILRLIAEGCTNEEIAGRLVITLHTVKKHSSNIFGKLAVNSRTQAVARARRLGWL